MSIWRAGPVIVGTTPAERTAMKYLMFVCKDDDPETDDSIVPDVEVWWNDANERGQWVLGDRLRPASDSRTVRVRGGVRTVTEGPFAETNEWIVGFDVLECASLEEAVEVAAGHPMAYGGKIEVRPFWPLDDD
jgi:hypothetical protein